jgi:soluble lytic murein transglycosylase-like protein
VTGHGGWPLVVMVVALLVAVRWGYRLIAVGLLVAVAVSAGLIPALTGGTPTAGPLAAGAPVPAQYRPWIERAGGQCPQIGPALLAAQLTQESGFNPAARSGAGAQGIAQFMPGTWRTWGTDGDGNGTASVWEPADAITAQGRFMCHLAGAASAALAAGRVAGDVVDLALAGYNAGFGAVEHARGVPAISETRGYVARIRGLADTYSDPSHL